MNAATASPSTVAQRVWGLPVRVSHWLLVVCFFDARLTREGDATRMWHMLFGYSLAFLIAFRIVWGFVGIRYARFGDFIKGPRAVAGYAGGLVRGCWWTRTSFGTTSRPRLLARRAPAQAKCAGPDRRAFSHWTSPWLRAAPPFPNITAAAAAAGCAPPCSAPTTA